MSETGVNLFDYVNSKEVFVKSVYMSKCLMAYGDLPARPNIPTPGIPDLKSHQSYLFGQRVGD